jgi:hypothetical protein
MRYATKEEAITVRRERENLRNRRAAAIRTDAQRKHRSKLERERQKRLWESNGPAHYEYLKKKWREDNRKRRENPKTKIVIILRKRLNNAVKAISLGGTVGWKYASTLELLGCSWAELEIWIENQFKPRMTWKNHGRKWHIDHIVECCKFDLTREDEQRRCFHYTNLRPMWAKANVSRKRFMQARQPGLGI